MSMSAKHRNIISNNRVYLLKNLICNDDYSELFFTVLMQNDIFTENMVQQVKCLKTDASRASKFLDLLERRGPDAFKTFIRALIVSHQEPVATKIDAKMTKEVQEELNPSATNPEQPESNVSDTPSSAETNVLKSQSEVPMGQSSGSKKHEAVVEKIKEETRMTAPSEKAQSQYASSERGRYVTQASDDAMDCGDTFTSSSLSREWQSYLTIYAKGGAEFMSDDIAAVRKIEAINCGRFVLVAEPDAESNVVNQNLSDFFEKLGFKQCVLYENIAQPLSDILEKEQEILMKSTELLDGFAMMVMRHGLIGSTDKFVSDALSFFSENPKLSNAQKFFCCQLLLKPPSKEDADTVDQANLGTTRIECTPIPGANKTAVLSVTTQKYEDLPNILPWAIIKVFSRATESECLESLLKKVREFIVEEDERKKLLKV